MEFVRCNASNLQMESIQFKLKLQLNFFLKFVKDKLFFEKRCETHSEKEKKFLI